MTKKDIFILVLVSFTVGILYSGIPHFVRYDALKEQGKSYTVLTKETSGDMVNFYYPRYREILDGKFFSSEIDLYENEGTPFKWAMLSDLVIAPFLLVTGSITQTVVVTDFLFPIFIFLVLFFILKEITANKTYALFGALAILLLPRIINYIPPFTIEELKVFILHHVPFLTEKVVYKLSLIRREAYIPAAPFLLLALLFAYRGVLSKKTAILVGSGLLYGLLFYLYWFYAVYATLFLVIYTGIYFFIDRIKAMRCAIIAGVGLLVTIPYWINHYYLTQLPFYEELLLQVGIELTHMWQFGMAKYYVAFVIIIGALWYLQRWSPATIFVSSLLLAGIAATNMQVITGFNLLSDHWITRVFTLVYGISLALLVFAIGDALALKPGIKKAAKYTAAAVLVYFIISIGYAQVIFSERNALRYTRDDAHVLNAYEWLNHNTERDSVVFTPALNTLSDIPVYTHNKIFVPRINTSTVNEDQIFERIYIAGKFFGLENTYIQDAVFSDLGEYFFFLAKYRSHEVDATLSKISGFSFFPENHLENIVDKYKAFTLPDTIPYRIDYIFIGPEETALGVRPETFSNFEEVYNEGGVNIYKYAE